MISKEKWLKLKQRMAVLEIFERDIDEQYILGSGAGGQKVNKTNSCVQLRHAPSGIDIKCQKSRTRDDNRYFARKRLCDKIDEMKNQSESEQQKRMCKIKRQKKRRSRKAKQKMLDEKKRRGEVKAGRMKPGVE